MRVKQISPRLWQAIRAGDHAAVLKQARLDVGLSQQELGDRFGSSASTISRFESGRRGLRDVAVLRRLAQVLDLPPEAFGLNATRADGVSSQRGAGGAPNVEPNPMTEEDDPVRRRAFLIAAGLAGSTVATSRVPASAAIAGPDPAGLLAHRLEAALAAPAAYDARPVALKSVQTALAVAAEDFHACRYLPLAERLPTLITTADSTLARGGDCAPAVTTARVYNLVTRALVKLRSSGLEWISADRALRAASQGDDALTMAESQRLMGSVFRRTGHHDRARTLTLQAADQLNIGRNTAPPEALSLHGVLMCSAGYAAARAGDRERAADLLDEAQATAARLTDHPARHRALVTNVISHQVSAAYVLGDAGTALHHARNADLRAFPNTERQGRFLVDVALAFAQWDKPQEAYSVLLDAERRAPGEIRTRSAVRGLVTDLMRHRRAVTLPGLRDLAIRTHALA